MAALSWLQQHWMQLSPTLLLALFAHPTVRRFIRVSITAAFEPAKLVAENLELAKQGSITSQRAAFYETNYSSMKSQVEILNQGIVKLQQDCIDLLRDADTLRAQLETIHKIATVRAESNQRLSADLEAAKTWGRLANESLGDAGLFPLPEPRWEAVGYNVLHPEDLGA